jgi:hypothetical protein
VIRPASILAAGAAALAAALAPAAAHAADPGRWFALNDTPVAAGADLGVTSDDDAFLFAGAPTAGLRTDLRLGAAVTSAQLLPADITALGYDRLGDWTLADGRVIAPLGCSAPPAQPPGACPPPALGILSPQLGWLGRVLLDPTDVAQVTWAEASPDGDLVWTSSGDDLIAYDTATVQAGETPIRPARRLVGAVPQGGIANAAFVDDRLFVAVPRGFQIWSIDLETGEPQLEIERPYDGQPAGLDVVDALGGELHWLISPDDPEGNSPTFGTGHSTIVSFVRREDAVIQMSAKPARIPVGEPTRVRVRAWLRYLDTDHPIERVNVAPPTGRGAATDKRGRATLTITAKKAGRLRLTGTKPPVSGGRVTIRAFEPKG